MANCPVEVTPFSQSEEIKNPNIFNLNYTNQNFWSMKSRLIDFIEERFGPNGTEIPNTFNDLVESSIAIMLIENWAFLADTLSFKMDQIANELFIDTVAEPDNAFRLSRLVGFKPTPPIAARALFTATVATAVTSDIVVSTPVILDTISDDGAITYELFPATSNNEPIFDEDIIIPAGKLTNSAIVGVEGTTITDVFGGTGAVLQSYELPTSPVLLDSISVEVDGALWEQVDFFTDSQPRREYRVEFDSLYRAFVMFGNNRAGMIPSNGSEISITYRSGGGVNGNIVTGFITQQRQAAVPGLLFSVPVTFNNYTKGEFGYNGDTIEEIRRKLPAFLRTQDRAVTGLDYKTLADQFATPFHGQIGKSTAVLRSHGCSANIIDLYILAKDGVDGLAEATNDLKAELQEEIDSKKMITDFVCIRDGEVLEVDVAIEVVADRFQRKFQKEILENVQRRVDSFFSINNWEYKQDLKSADLIKEMADIKQATGYEVTFTTNDATNSGSIVTANFSQIIRPDEVTISFLFT